MSDLFVRKFGEFFEPRRSQKCAELDHFLAVISGVMSVIAFLMGATSANYVMGVAFLIGYGFVLLGYYSGNLNVMFGCFLIHGVLSVLGVSLVGFDVMEAISFLIQALVGLILLFRIMFSPYTFDRKSKKKVKVVRGVMPPGESNYPREYDELG
ncbi:MAG: hypothetical protein KDC26_07050 [Armatimonadetes bacterium]|nr:hypothetical protein [Armatimonadota bacterium]